MKEAENFLKTELMPFLKEITERPNSDTTVVFYECEKVEVNGWGDFKDKDEVDDKNYNIERWNDLLKEVVPDLKQDLKSESETNSKNQKIFRISANKGTTLSPIENKTLMTDGIHLGWQRPGPKEFSRRVVAAQPLLVDINILLNLLCNKYLEENEKYCCGEL